ncbi:MAG: VOC family protein [Thermodesulfobacteriota bacterium]
MKIKRITEIGVAVRDLDKATRLMVDLLGAEAGAAISMDLYQMRYRLCRVGGVDFELMEPINGQGMIADYIAKRGAGLHHVAFAVEDIEDGMRVLKEKGVKFVSDQPLPISSHGQDMAGKEISGVGLVNFSRPESILGILFEFIQYPEGCEFE